MHPADETDDAVIRTDFFAELRNFTGSSQNTLKTDPYRDSRGVVQCRGDFGGVLFNLP